MATKKIKFPRVTKGTHLTVTEHQDGTVEMDWDWDKLVEEINQAISKIEKPKPKLEVVKNKKSKK